MPDSTPLDPTAKAVKEVIDWIDWAIKSKCHLPAARVVADVVNAYAGALIPNGTWFPIESLPEGRHVLLYFEEGEKGNGGIECGTVYFNDRDLWTYMTHGGANAGDFWEPRNNEKPTHWMPLPEPPT